MQEVTRTNGRASNVLDGSAATIWHSRWSPAPAAPLPHTITIDTKATRSIGGFRYLPRADNQNGRVGKYSIGVSSDGITWRAVASGTWPDTIAEKTVTFTTVSARYLRLTATTEAGNRGRWSSAAEINLLPRRKGRWGPTIHFPLDPGLGCVLPGNRLLTWSAYYRHLRRQLWLHTDSHPGPLHRCGEPGHGCQHRPRHVLPRGLDAGGREDHDQRRCQQLEDHHLQPGDQRMELWAGHGRSPAATKAT